MKKVVSAICCAGLLTGSFMPAYAAVKNETITSSAYEDKVSMADGLSSIVLKVKSKINILEELTEFEYNYYEASYAPDSYWNLRWSNEENTKRIRVNVDGQGNIKSYSYYENKESNAKPTYLKEELKPVADEFINSVLPELKDSIQFKDATFNGVYSGGYTYTYERIENGILMPENTITVSVNYENKNVTSLSVNWAYDVVIPDSSVNLTKDEAKAKLKDEVEMKLVYRNKYEDDKITAYLVYVPNNTYMAVDAKTGEVYDTKNEWLTKDEAEKNMMAMDSAASTESAVSGGASLKEKELTKIQELNSLISKEKAIDIVKNNKNLLIDENIKSATANLSQNYSSKGETKYVWRINLSDPRDIDYKEKDAYSAYANAVVDAKTGEIISFRASVRSFYDEESEAWKNAKVNYSKEEGKKIFEEFAKEQISDKFSKTIEAENRNGYILKYVNDKPVYGGYSYNYNRVNEGIEYTYNSISGAVDGVTGKIYSFSYSWNDNVLFESPKNAMSKQDAFDAYISKDGFDLVYEINNKHIYDENYNPDYSDAYVRETEVRLVYRTDITPSQISPFTGTQIDSSGDEYIGKAKYEYSDISGHWAEREIKLLTDVELGFDGGKFMPDTAITREELSKILSRFYYSKKELTDEEKKANLTKIDMVKMAIEYLNLEEIAEIEGIYKTGFNDESKLKDDIGYVALAKGLNIISGDTENNFNPDKALSRAEAAVIVLKMIALR